LVFQLREELNEATFHLEYAISPEDMYIYDFSLALDVTVNIGFLRAFVGELEFEIVKLGTAVDLSIGEYNASYEILPPPGVETSSTPPKGTSRFNDTRFANFAGIPFDQGIITTRTVVKAEDVVDGVVQGINTDGIPYIGSPSAPIVIAEFSDFSCPHCANFAPTVDLMVARYVRSGQLRLEYYPLTFVGREFSVNAASAAICAGQQGAFWEYHLELYEWLQTRGAQSFVPDELVKLAGEFELDIDQFELCLASNLPAITLETARRLQQDNGVNATPTLIYRTNTDTTWSRFVDANGNSLTRPSDDELFQIIESYNNNK
jgi:protein-disulfide isomerase